MSSKDIEQRIKKTSEYQLAPDGKGNNTTTQLPVEVTKDIAQKAEDFANSHINGRTQREIWDTVFAAYGSGATAYATQLYQLQQENAELRRQNDKMKQQAEGWRPLLEEVLSKHETGGCDLLLMERIKTFLYGE